MARMELAMVGGDVEVFLKGPKDKPVPVCGLLGGTKENPKVVPDLADWGDRYSAYQEDNVMAEFNIMPTYDAERFARHTTLIRDHVAKLIAEKGYNISITASEEFTPEQLSSKQAQVVGCMPDFNAWKFQENPTLGPEVLGNVRTSGGHIHVSYECNVAHDDPAYAEVQAKLVRMLDYWLGVPSIVLDTDSRRRQFYGKAGAYRPKDYGVEYRVLSNFWIANQHLMQWVFNGVKRAVSLFNQAHNNLLSDAHSRAVIQIINTGDVDAALHMIRSHGIQMPYGWKDPAAKARASRV